MLIETIVLAALVAVVVGILVIGSSIALINALSGNYDHFDQAFQHAIGSMPEFDSELDAAISVTAGKAKAKTSKRKKPSAPAPEASV